MPLLHPKLEPFKDRRSIKRLSALLEALEKDLADLHCAEYAVDLIEQSDSPGYMERFLAVHRAAQLERVMRVRSRVLDRDVSVLVPMREAQIWPYSLEIELRAAAPGFAAYEQSLDRKQWLTEPKNDALAKGLQALDLPKTKWTCSDRAMKYKLSRAFEIVPGDADAPATWRVHSGYFPASMAGGKLPKVSCFVEAVPRLEEFLAAQS
jgi:hypothetical protein